MMTATLTYADGHTQTERFDLTDRYRAFDLCRHGIADDPTVTKAEITADGRVTFRLTRDDADLWFYAPLSWDAGDDDPATVFYGVFRSPRLMHHNGFVMPAFPKAEADRIAAWNHAAAAADPGSVADISYDPVADNYVMTWPDLDSCEAVNALCVCDDRDDSAECVLCYPIGAGDWTWCVADCRGALFDALPSCERTSFPHPHDAGMSGFILRTYQAPHGLWAYVVTDQQNDGVDFFTYSPAKYASRAEAHAAVVAQLTATTDSRDY